MGGKENNKKPLWAKGNSYNIGEETVVEVPMEYEQQQGSRVNRAKSKPDATYKEDPYENIALLTKYVVIKDKKGKYRSLTMKVMGSPMYFLAEHKKDLNENTFRQVGKDFTGYVQFYDWDENLLYGLRYQLGWIDATVAPAQRLKGARLQCYDTYIDHYDRSCSGGECTEWRYSYTEVMTTCSSTGGGGGGAPVVGGTPTENPGNPHGVGGQGGGQPLSYNFAGIHAPSISIHDYLKCFGTNQFADAGKYKFSITVYVQEPNTGTGASSWMGNVGHTCIGLTKINVNDSNDRVTQVIGFYPADQLLCSV